MVPQFNTGKIPDTFESDIALQMTLLNVVTQAVQKVCQRCIAVCLRATGSSDDGVVLLLALAAPTVPQFCWCCGAGDRC